MTRSRRCHLRCEIRTIKNEYAEGSTSHSSSLDIYPIGYLTIHEIEDLRDCFFQDTGVLEFFGLALLYSGDLRPPFVLDKKGKQVTEDAILARDTLFVV